MTIGIYCDPLRARTSATPGRGMVKELIRSRSKDNFILVVRNDYKQSQELVEFFEELKPFSNWKLQVEASSRKLLNIKALLGFRNFYNLSVNADVFINTDCTALGRTKKPLIITVADLSVFKGKEVSTYRSVIDFRLRRNMLKDGILQADRIVAISETTRQDLAEYFPSSQKQVQIVYNGIDNAWGTNQPAKLKDLPENYFIWWGHISERKNLTGLIKAYAAINQKSGEGPALPSLLIIFNNPSIPEEIAELVKASGIFNKVIFKPRLELQDLISAVGNSRGLIFPSYVEGFGLPVAEAMALGVPVLTSSVSAMPEVAGGNAILCNPFEINEIEEGIRLLMQPTQWEDEKVQQRKARGRMFTYQAAADNYSHIIDQLKYN